MLYWAAVFFVVSLVSGMLGLNHVAGFSMGVAEFLFWGFLILAGVFLALGITGARKARDLMTGRTMGNPRI